MHCAHCIVSSKDQTLKGQGHMCKKIVPCSAVWCAVKYASQCSGEQFSLHYVSIGGSLVCILCAACNMLSVISEQCIVVAAVRAYIIVCNVLLLQL